MGSIRKRNVACAYYIPTDQLDEAQETPCINVYQAAVSFDTPFSDLDYALDNGFMQVGFFCTTTGYFSGCQWKDVFCAESYVSVCNAEDQYALLNAEDGDVLLECRYAWVWPGEICDGWVYVWLFPSESNDDADFIPAYVHLDGRQLTAPEGTYFSEEPEPIQNQQVLLYHEDTGDAVWTDIASLP